MKRTLLRLVLVATFVLSAGLPMLGQETAKPRLPEEQRLQEERLPEQRLQEEFPQDERLLEQRTQEERLQEQRLQEEKLRLRRLSSARKLKVIYLTPEMKKGRPQDTAAIMQQSAAATTIPLWKYSTVAYDSNTYTGMMVGRSPFFNGARTTSIPTVIVPIIFNIGGTIFDPTTIDTACGFTSSAVTLVQQSPLLSNLALLINGTNVGIGQYTDLFQRSNFWTDVSVTGNNYHTVLSPVTVLSAITLTPTSTDAITIAAGICGLGSGVLGIISNTWFDGQLQGTIIPSLTGKVSPTVFPIFLLHNVVQSTATPPTSTACCILGYHNAFGIPLQTYSPLDFDGIQAFASGYTSTMSHEIAEWADDPAGTNAVPAWGAEGQQAGCQNNLEVGDPLSPGFATPTNEFQVDMPNGLTYALQELAFYSWFYGGTSLGTGGFYSDNGTFKGFAKACPPGGTN